MSDKNTKNAQEDEKNDASSESEIIYADKNTTLKARNHRKSDRSRSRTQNTSQSQATSKQVEVIDEEDLKNCFFVTNKLSESLYAYYFRTQPDPADEEGTNFMNAVEKPMDFQTLINNLNNKVYKTVADWRKDIVLIFENPLGYFQPKSMPYESALKLKDKFWKLNNIFTKTEEELWMNKIEKICSDYLAVENE